MRCIECDYMRKIVDEFNREWNICGFSQSSRFLQKAESSDYCYNRKAYEMSMEHHRNDCGCCENQLDAETCAWCSVNTGKLELWQWEVEQ